MPRVPRSASPLPRRSPLHVALGRKYRAVAENGDRKGRRVGAAARKKEMPAVHPRRPALHSRHSQRGQALDKPQDVPFPVHRADGSTYAVVARRKQEDTENAYLLQRNSKAEQGTGSSHGAYSNEVVAGGWDGAHPGLCIVRRTGIGQGSAGDKGGSIGRAGDGRIRPIDLKSESSRGIQRDRHGLPGLCRHVVERATARLHLAALRRRRRSWAEGDRRHRRQARGLSRHREGQNGYGKCDNKRQPVCRPAWSCLISVKVRHCSPGPCGRLSFLTLRP